MRRKRLVHATIGLVTIAAATLLQASSATAGVTAGTSAATASSYPTAYGPHVVAYAQLGVPRCLNNPGSSKANGTRMIIYTCVVPDTTNQLWYFGAQGGDPWYNIWNSAANKCLTVQGASTADNAPVIQWTCTAGANEEWKVVSVASICNSDGNASVCFDLKWIVNRNSGKCLTVTNASQASGATLLQYECNFGTNQEWTLG